MAVKANKLLSACDFAERCQLGGPRWSVDNSNSGSRGSTGASHLPLLQQKDACLPCNRSAPHIGQALCQIGMVQQVRPIAFAKPTHHPMGDVVLGDCCLHLSENAHNGAVKAYISRRWRDRQRRRQEKSVRDASWLRTPPSCFPRLLYILLLVVLFAPTLTTCTFLVTA